MQTRPVNPTAVNKSGSGLLKTDSFTERPLDPQHVMKPGRPDYGPTGKSCCCCDVDPLGEFCCGSDFYHKCCGGYPV